jgi:iron complex transport system ATP-binding protein
MNIALDQIVMNLGGRRVLDRVTANIAPGRVTAIIGPNGAGKTSLMRAILSLAPLESGQITVGDDSLDAINLSERGRRFGYLPQSGQPHWNVLARELVALGRLPHRARFAGESAHDRAATNAAMIATDTAHLAERTMDALSGGERARVMIARVLTSDPAWMLVDEPLTSLDPPHQQNVLKLLSRSAADGKGVLVILHDLNAAAQIADDVIMMRSCGIIAAGASAAVLTPEHLNAAFDMDFDIHVFGGRRVIIPA